MKFITRGGKQYHIAEQALVEDLPAWRKMPYCRNGGINLTMWELVERDPFDLTPEQVCGSCINRAVAKGFSLPFMRGYPHEHD